LPFIVADANLTHSFQALAGLAEEESTALSPSQPSSATAATAAVAAAAVALPSDTDESALEDGGKKMSKAAKVRAKKAAAEAERERAIAEAKLTARDYAAEENAAIEAKLKPRGLKIVQVPSDGNCLYRSLLRQWSSRLGASTYQDIRSIVANEMREHGGEYSSFVECEEGEDYDGSQRAEPRFSTCMCILTTSCYQVRRGSQEQQPVGGSC
jgi:hypothetical protein